MKPTSLLLWLTCLLQGPAIYPQTPSYYHYTTADGLASSTVYDILQARDGYIWFATMNGISRFDGTHFITFRTNDGLNSNSIISLAEGRNGELFIGNYEKGINVLRNGQIADYCSEINGKPIAISFLLPVFIRNSAEKLYAYRSWGQIHVISEKREAGRSGYTISVHPQLLVKLEQLTNGELIGITNEGLFAFKDEKLTRMPIEGLPDTAFYSFSNGIDGSFLLGTKGMIHRIKNKKVVEKHRITVAGNNDVSAILQDRNGNTWFSIMNKGFYLIPVGSDTILDMGIKMGLENTLVNQYLEDSEGNIWISTFGKGVFCLKNLYLSTFNENEGLSNNNVFSILKDNSDHLLAGTFNGVNLLEQGRFYQIRSNSGKTLTEYIYSIKNINNDFYICGSFGEKKIKDFSYKGIKLYMIDHPAFCKTSQGLYIFGTGSNSIIVRQELHSEDRGIVQFYIFGDSTQLNRVNEIFEDSEQNLWIGTGLGLCKVTGLNDLWGKRELKRQFFPGDPILSARINSIFQDTKKNIWFAGEKGIASYSLETGTVSSLINPDGYDLSSSTSLTMDNKQRLWIGTMTGLFMFDEKSGNQLYRQTGLPADEVLSLYFDPTQNILYVGTSDGISLLDIGLFESYHPSPPTMKITGIKAGDSVFSDFTNLVFSPLQHDVYIDFKALHFSSPGSVKYMYNFNDEWIETGHDFLNLISLQHGTYTLQIRAKAENTGWSEPYILTFRVLPKFIETGWFLLLMISVVAGISFLIVRWRVKSYEKKVSKELELTERFNTLEHHALSAMMNPHFISNSLNSVQYLVNSGRYEEANNYIAMIAKLMRKNLDSAGSGFILLSEEIYRLKLYLDLEKLRFQDGFSYEIFTGPDVDPEAVMIPNMIIQPFAENSLWHGIINSGRKGVLTISFAFEEVDIDSSKCRSLVIKVTDNGIGMKEARKHQKEDHLSKGINIIEERLRLLSAKMHLPQPVLFEDLNSRGANSHGTEVIISLPPPLYQSTAPGSDPAFSPTG